MKEFRGSLAEIIQKEKGLFFGMIALMILAIVLFIVGMVKVPWGSSVAKVGYGDIGRYQGGEWVSMVNAGGYHDGRMYEMLAYPVLALLFGILHNLLAVKIYQKKGDGAAKILVYVSIGLVISAFVVLLRLSGSA